MNKKEKEFLENNLYFNYYGQRREICRRRSGSNLQALDSRLGP